MRCSDVSERAGERLGATATAAEHWLLVEVPGTWQRDVAKGEGLGDRVRRTVVDWLEATPSSRLLFIRRPGRGRGARLAFVAAASEDGAELRRIELSAPDELARLDLSKAGQAVDSELVLVCGHGTRDACCAHHGTAIYGALASSLEDDQLWISSHQGGHRFAGNVLVLPEGIQLGRVDRDNAGRLVAHALSGRVDLDHHRGRVVYTKRVQAAERAVREAFALDRLDDLRLVSEDGDRVVLRGPDGREHAAEVEEHAGPSVPASCGIAAEPQTALTARLV